MKIAITGHRPNKLGNDYDLTSPLVLWIKAHIIDILDTQHIKNFGNLTLITGMALGIDTLFAQIAIENNIPFVAAIPCSGQDSKWILKSQKLYSDLITNTLCTRYYVSDKPYNNTCMQIRNKWMVDNCDLLIAVWDGSSGGTSNCVKYAQSKNKKIIFINPKKL